MYNMDMQIFGMIIAIIVFTAFLVIGIATHFQKRTAKRKIFQGQYLGPVNLNVMEELIDYAEKNETQGFQIVDTEDANKWIRITFYDKGKHKVKMPSSVDRYYIDESKEVIEEELDEKDGTYTLIIETDIDIHCFLYTVFCESSLKMGKLCKVTYLFDTDNTALQSDRTKAAPV